MEESVSKKLEGDDKKIQLYLTREKIYNGKMEKVRPTLYVVAYWIRFDINN